MEEKYRNYIVSFNVLEDDDKIDEIINNLKDLINVFYKVNNDLNINNNILPVTNDNTLTDIFTYILSLKKLTSGTLEAIYDNFYEGGINE